MRVGTGIQRPLWQPPRACLLCGVVGLLSAAANPAMAAPIKAAVLRSTGTVFLGQTIWRELNAGWDQFGKTAVTIDYSSLAGTITSTKLQTTSADMLIVSTTGPSIVYSDSEIIAIKDYIQAGHGIVITYESLNNNNRKLAPLVGLTEEMQEGTNVWSAGFTFDPLVPDHPLFAHMDQPYRPGCNALAAPLPYRSEWKLTTGIAVAEARFQTTSGFFGNGIIVANEGPGYRGVYFGHYPENKADGANLQDMHLFYNAIVWTGAVPEPATLFLALMGGTLGRYNASGLRGRRS